MMNDFTYRLVVNLIDAFFWGGELVNPEDLPSYGPAVFISNHLGSTGPIGLMCSLPIRLFPWVQEETASAELAPEFMRTDFVEPELHLRMPWSLRLSKLISKFSTPLIAGLGCIPVYHIKAEREETIRLSIQYLRQGRFLYITPEDDTKEPDPVTKLRPFKKGAAWLGGAYYNETGECIKYYPAAVHASRRVLLGKPISYNPTNPPAEERLRLTNLLEDAVRRLYLEQTMKEYVGVPLPR